MFLVTLNSEQKILAGLIHERSPRGMQPQPRVHPTLSTDNSNSAPDIDESSIRAGIINQPATYVRATLPCPERLGLLASILLSLPLSSIFLPISLPTYFFLFINSFPAASHWLGNDSARRMCRFSAAARRGKLLRRRGRSLNSTLNRGKRRGRQFPNRDSKISP